MVMDDMFVIDEATQQQFETIAIRRLVRKLDWRLIPFLFLIEMVQGDQKGMYQRKIFILHE
jgi:hypothetical protein